MGINYKNRALIISLALAASGILTCGLALADIFLPRGSAILVLVSIPLLGGLVAGRVDRLRLDLRIVGPARLPSRSKPNGSQAKKPWQVVSARGPNACCSSKPYLHATAIDYP